MSITLFNSLTRQATVFTPYDPSRVTVYLCGPTVYNYVHIGNARGPVIVDVLVKLLRRHYPHVIYARNLTDVDDKINAAAAEQGLPIQAITERFIAAYHEDMAALGIAPPDIEPRATAHIDEIQAMIERLLVGGHAYEAAGHVLFDVASYPEYGALSGHTLAELIAGARVEVAPYKRQPSDFVLWKPSDANQPGWDSPWGRGRPGWHIECSAMCAAHLGATLDIHAGGLDLKFPHHENEIAQSRCSHSGAVFARWWLHNGLLSFDGRKMSKSLGNVQLVRDLRQRHPAEALRLLLLRGHYRQPLDWSEQAISQAVATLDHWYRVLRDLPELPPTATAIPPAIEAALADDLNTPQALAELARLADQARAQADATSHAALLAGGAALGLLQQTPEAWFRQASQPVGVDEAQVEALLHERQAARAARDFARADAIRDQLTTLGVAIEDSAQGSRWSVIKA